MKTLPEITTALNSIRALLDADVSNAIIEDVQAKAINLSQMMGLSAEAMASAKKLLDEKEIEIFVTKSKDMEKFSPSVQIRFLKAHCKEEAAIYEYSDRLQSGIVHSLDTLRTVISLYKTELQNSMKQ